MVLTSGLWCSSRDMDYDEFTQDNSILLYQVVPSASKLEAGILTEFELNLDHPGGNEERSVNSNHQESESRPSGGKC